MSVNSRTRGSGGRKNLRTTPWTRTSGPDSGTSGERRGAKLGREQARRANARAMRGRRRCRLHGGLNPGAPRGARNGNFTDGTWSAEAIEERRWLRSLVRSFGKPENTP